MKKTAIITGASRGIGRAIALEFAKNGWDIAINSSKSPEDLKSLKNEILILGGSCICFQGDVGNAQFVNDMVNQTMLEFGRIDCLINNAGISYIGLLTDMTVDDWNQIITTNLTSVFHTCHSVIPHMVHEKCGKIINISSVWGEVGASCEVAYSASKGGMNAMTKALAKELAPSNIQVNAISCGAIDTSMNEFLDDSDKQFLIDEIPAGRMGTCNEVAHTALSLACAATYLTGQIIRLDGGWL